MHKVLVFLAVILGSGMASPSEKNMMLAPTIYFYSNGSAPIPAWRFSFTQGITVMLYDSLNQTGNQSKAIDTLVLRGDSLIIYPYGNSSTVRPNPYARAITFNKPGLYRAFEGLRSSTSAYTYTNLKPLGSFRIYPGYSTTPARPLPSDSVSIKLTMGLTHSACPPGYESSFTIIGREIQLKYREIPFNGACIAIYVDPPIPYGPVYEVGKLDQGSYALFIEDSVFVDSIYITKTLNITGNVVAMQSPYIMSPVRSIGGMEVLAFPESDCSYSRTDTIRTLTDAYGNFALPVSASASRYRVIAGGNDDGYFPQTAYFQNTAQQTPISFELISETGGMEPKIDFSVHVKNAGAPVESATVVLYEGRMMVFSVCYAKSQAGQAYPTSHSGVTGKDGGLVLGNLPLSPFIDYEYWIYKSIPGGSTKSASGKIRMNLYAQNELAVDFATPPPSIRSAYTPQIAKNLINTSLTSFGLRVQWLGQGRPERITIHDIQGRVMGKADEVNENSFTFGARLWPNGIYLVRVKSENGIQTKRIQITR